MARGKKMTRRLWPQPGAAHDFDADDDLLDEDDFDDDFGDLERLLGDPLDRVVMAIARPPRRTAARATSRPITAARTIASTKTITMFQPWATPYAVT